MLREERSKIRHVEEKSLNRGHVAEKEEMKSSCNKSFKRKILVVSKERNLWY